MADQPTTARLRALLDAAPIGPETDWGTVPTGYSDNGNTKSIALALCAAALRARAADAEWPTLIETGRASEEIIGALKPENERR